MHSASLSSFASAPHRPRANNPPWTLTDPAISASVDELQAASAKVLAEKFVEAIALFERDAYSFDAEGRAAYRHSIVYRIETEAGVEGWSETRSQWEPGTRTSRRSAPA